MCVGAREGGVGRGEGERGEGRGGERGLLSYFLCSTMELDASCMVSSPGSGERREDNEEVGRSWEEGLAELGICGQWRGCCRAQQGLWAHQGTQQGWGAGVSGRAEPVKSCVWRPWQLQGSGSEERGMVELEDGTGSRRNFLESADIFRSTWLHHPVS